MTTYCRKKVLCLIATELEADQLIPEGTPSRKCLRGLTEYYLDESYDVYVGITGIGMVNAAMITERFLSHFSDTTAVLNIGIAGISDESICHLSDWAVISEEWLGDLGIIMSDEFLTLESIGFPLYDDQKHPWNRVSVSEKLANQLASKFNKPLVPGITVNGVSGSETRIRELKKIAPTFVESMEGAAIAHVCFQHGVNFVEVRGISNIVGERNKSYWQIKPALENLSGSFSDLLKTISEFDSKN